MSAALLMVALGFVVGVCCVAWPVVLYWPPGRADMRLIAPLAIGGGFLVALLELAATR